MDSEQKLFFLWQTLSSLVGDILEEAELTLIQSFPQYVAAKAPSQRGKNPHHIHCSFDWRGSIVITTFNVGGTHAMVTSHGNLEVERDFCP